jgi:hypothetical protein
MDAKKIFGWDALARVRCSDLEDGELIFHSIFLHHGPSKSVFRYVEKDTIVQRIPAEELVFLQFFLESRLGWDLSSTEDIVDDPRLNFVIENEIHNETGEFCRVGDKNLTQCDLLVQLSLITQSSSWDLPMVRLCDWYRRPIEKRAVERMQKVSILTKRPHYFFHRVTNIKRLRKMDLMRLCRDEINWNYLKKKLDLPDVQVLMAKRSISKLSEICKPPYCMETRKGLCKAPDPWSVFRALYKNKSDYETFKTDLMTRFPDPIERNNHLCSLPLKPVGSVLGGFCIFSESETQIIIWILCSDRAMGKALLERFKSTGKSIIIDHPLSNVLGFYTKCGFISVDPLHMIYEPPHPLPVKQQLLQAPASPLTTKKLIKDQQLLPPSAPSPRTRKSSPPILAESPDY